ncbi:helix-turn-helix domain-containing protein [Microbacterium horticulturae]|uniref:Helix-turn-helix domain-containing protein n=1 Tax=Microbacterium horticulturae TaxID=3028316 RepID=A0ABY8C0Y7_9MICO|nr:helix-turn-helix domain-containing protein [Microbacterium sp. KACC 23027]WEG10109.1 helix-turn-helix domain-containing protein [Microbacterium sp. KACC 23027]
MATGIRASRREDVLRLLDEADEPLTVATLAARLGTHPNTVRLHLDKLLAEGRVERTTDGRGSPGRPAQLFRRACQEPDAGPGRYRMLAEILVDELAESEQPQRAALEAGRRWGRREAERAPVQEPVEGLVNLLERVGFQPRACTADGRVDVCRCPFFELAREHPDVVCSVHLGLMQGALQTWGGETTVESLERREDPDVCTAHLAAHTA